MSYNGIGMLRIQEMLDGDLARIRNVIRFSNSTRIKDESVAEHSYFTAYYAMVLAMSLIVEEGVPVDMGVLLTSAILHDMDESKSGDFVRHFKYMDADLKRHIEDASSKMMRNAFDPIFVKERLVLREGEPSHSLQYLWRNAKDNTIEGDIVAFADFLSVLSYVMNELDCGNRKLLRQLDDMHEYAMSFYKRKFIKYEEVKSWLFQVMALLNKYGMRKED